MRTLGLCLALAALLSACGGVEEEELNVVTENQDVAQVQQAACPSGSAVCSARCGSAGCSFITGSDYGTSCSGTPWVDYDDMGYQLVRPNCNEPSFGWEVYLPSWLVFSGGGGTGAAPCSVSYAADWGDWTQWNAYGSYHCSARYWFNLGSSWGIYFFSAWPGVCEGWVKCGINY